jgi:hypothetical protein
MLESQLIEDVLDAWVLDQNHPRRDREKKPIPDPGDIKQILDQAFLASMKREEDRPIAFCLAYLNKEDAKQTQLTSYRQIIITFGKELPFTVDGISKIASAFDPKISCLAVGKNREEGKFSIWGGMFFGPSTDFFNNIPAAIMGHIFFRPDVFMVTVSAAGSFVISRGDSQIGMFSSGEFVRATPTPFFHAGLGVYLEKIMEQLHGYKTFKVHFYRDYIASLRYLLLQSVERGHGSTVVLLPPTANDVSLPLVPKYSFNEKLTIENLIYETTNQSINHTEHSLIWSVAYKKKLSERLDFLSQLSVVDGALVLYPNLEVLTFGSTLNAGSFWKGTVTFGPDGFGGGGEVFDLSKHGTRHNSAIQFVAACPGAIAFVISQDGPIRAFTMKDGDSKTILCWPDCRTSMFI